MTILITPSPWRQAVSSGEVQRGVLTCGTGVGHVVCANRSPKVRAALAWNEQVAELSARAWGLEPPHLAGAIW